MSTGCKDKTEHPCHTHNHLHQAGINIHKHTRPLAQVNFLGIHALLIVWCVNIYLYTLQIPRSIHLAHNFPYAPNVERDTITHTGCVYLILKIKYTVLMRERQARDRERVLRHTKTNSHRHVYIHYKHRSMSRNH